ncbi:MAG TPA: hypothetical protein VNS80_09235, partial [Pseudolysinimonas sp.]|nr:hypothetical protein [Pseudolysinimonas sp.]
RRRHPPSYREAIAPPKVTCRHADTGRPAAYKKPRFRDNLSILREDAVQGNVESAWPQRAARHPADVEQFGQ